MTRLMISDATEQTNPLHHKTVEQKSFLLRKIMEYWNGVIRT